MVSLCMGEAAVEVCEDHQVRPRNTGYESRCPSFAGALDDMLVLDALILNTDRYFGNFGFLVENETNRIIAPAPLFDHGNSLFNFAGGDDLESDETLTRYANTLFPCVYDDFISAAKGVLTPERKKGLRRLLGFKFKKHSRYNLPEHRLRLIEHQIQRRAQQLLE